MSTMSRNMVSVVVAAVAALVIAPGSVSAAPILDQSHLPGTNYYNPLGPTYVVNQITAEMTQTLTIGVSGTLESVWVDLFAPYGGNATLSIVPVVGGVPDTTGTPLATASQPVFAASPTFIKFDVSAASLQVTAGDTLAYWLVADELSRWLNSGGNTYAGGQAFWRFPGATDGSPTDWAVLGQDAYFESYVSVPEPTAIGAVASGSVMLLRRLRHAA